MKADYADILRAAADHATYRTKWFDENGTPRFTDHHPDFCPDIYANEVVLLEVGCQSCGRLFNVQMSWSLAGALLLSARAMSMLPPGSRATPPDSWKEHGKLSLAVADGSIHYGDPPNVNCCPAGPTMNCHDLRVLEFWTRIPPVDKSHVGALTPGWRRVPELEITLPDGTAES